MESRQCGKCVACCEIMGVAEFGKPYYQMCQHCIPKQGCGIYHTRPEPCREFACAWLNGDLDRNLRPDTCGVMVIDDYDQQRLELYEVRPGAFGTPEGDRCVKECLRESRVPLLLYPYRSLIPIRYKPEAPYADFGESTIDRANWLQGPAERIRIWPIVRPEVKDDKS